MANKYHAKHTMKFTVYIEPVAKARARTVVQRGKVHSFTPRKTEWAEWAIRQALVDVTGLQYFALPVAVKIDVTFYIAKPKSAPKKRTMPTTKPDWDNLGKTITDALEKYLYENDSQITTAVIKKRYGSPPRIEIEIEEDEG